MNWLNSDSFYHSLKIGIKIDLISKLIVKHVMNNEYTTPIFLHNSNVCKPNVHFHYMMSLNNNSNDRTLKRLKIGIWRKIHKS